MGRTMRAGAKGIKTGNGRLDGAEIARSESFHDGSIPLQSSRRYRLRYAIAIPHTAPLASRLGYKGEVFKARR
jgi:small subunit ribosomal protein S3